MEKKVFFSFFFGCCMKLKDWIMGNSITDSHVPVLFHKNEILNHKNNNNDDNNENNNNNNKAKCQDMIK